MQILGCSQLAHNYGTIDQKKVGVMPSDYVLTPFSTDSDKTMMAT